MATRRAAAKPASDAPRATQPPPPPPPASPMPRSLPLSINLELALLSIYPLTLLLGSLYSHLSVSTQQHPYNPLIQAHDPSTAPSYFARKDNLFNVYFVKRGWFWTTVVFVVLQASLYLRGGGDASRRLRALARFALVTTAWVLVTQWSFGPALIDRAFALSGGLCDLEAAGVVGDAARVVVPREGVKAVGQIGSGRECRAVGGLWRGGHDVSGHVFLLVLGSGTLVYESLAGAGEWVGKVGDGRGWRWAEVPAGVKVAWAVAAGKWWMLLMTAAFFHTWFEKFTGLVVALATLGVVYMLPRSVPALGRVLGTF